MRLALPMLFLVGIPALLALGLFLRWRSIPYRPGTVRLPFAPPLPPLLGIALGAACETLVPTSLLPWPGRLWIGIGLVALGLTANIAAFLAFRRAGANPDPGAAPPALVARGIFKVSRNPMYMGFLLVVAGIGVWADSAWIVAMAVPAWTILRQAIVLREEAYLAERFPKPYQAYRQRVRRWL